MQIALVFLKKRISSLKKNWISVAKASASAIDNTPQPERYINKNYK